MGRGGKTCRVCCAPDRSLIHSPTPTMPSLSSAPAPAGSGSFSTLGRMAGLLSQRGEVDLWTPMMGAEGQELGPWPAGTIRPNRSARCLALKGPTPGCSLGPDGGKAFPNLSSVIKGKLIFTKQTPKERGGHEKRGHAGRGPEAPLPAFNYRTAQP